MNTQHKSAMCAINNEKNKNAEAIASALLYVGIDLSSRSVSRQVLSALVSLTSVFGMGTGGPSPLKHQLFQDCTLKTKQRSKDEPANKM